MNQGWSGRSTISGNWPSGDMPEKIRPAVLERIAIVDVDLIAVAVALADHVRAVDRADDAVAVELGRIGAEPHGAAEVAAGGALLQPLLAHPFGDQADDRLGGLAELGGRRLADPGEVPRALDAGHLHAEADAEEGDLALAGELDRGDLALAAALAEAAGDEDAVQRLELGDDVGVRDARTARRRSTGC